MLTSIIGVYGLPSVRKKREMALSHGGTKGEAGILGHALKAKVTSFLFCYLTLCIYIANL